MKKLLIISVILCSTLGVKAQQNPLYTQYMFNPFIINPAITGTHSFYQVWMNSRLQWIGMTDAPVTNTLSIYGPLETKDMGVGGYVFSDVLGAESRLGASGSYAYNFAINDEYRMSFGLHAGFIQYKMDKTQLTFTETERQMFVKEQYFVPDASVGAYFYNNILHVGFSATQLFNNKVDVLQDSAKTDLVFGRLKSHFYLTGGYKRFLTRDIAIEPTLILRAVVPATPQVDVNVRVIYQEMVWGGISFRSQDALAFVGGYSYDNKIFVGISYDVGVNKLSASHVGSFEAVIGVVFDKIKF